ncbi:phosphoglycerate kinase, partial [Suillus hirtellus]
SALTSGLTRFTFAKILDHVSMSSTDSLFDQAGSEKVGALVKRAKKNNVKVVFPIDFITADKFDKNGVYFASCLFSQTGTASVAEGIPSEWMGLDASPKSRELFRQTVLEAKTILWNGPPGVFQFPAFAGGSKA